MKPKVYSKCWILIIEDDEGLNTLLQRILKRAGYFTEGVFSGENGIMKTVSQAYTLLLLDYKLPDMSAAQLVEQLRGKGINIPFVVMTGHGDENIAVNMMKLGARDYLSKDENYIEKLPLTIGRVIDEIEIEKNFSETQEKLNESQKNLNFERAQLLSIYESITEPISIIDPDTYEILYSNTAFKEHFGEIADNICYRHVYKAEKVCDFCPVPIMNKQNLQTYHWEQQNSLNGHWYQSIDKIIQWHGRNVHFQLSVDITDLKQTQQALVKAKEKAEESDHLKTAFLANMSHEIRTPMNAIVGFTDIMIKEELDRGSQLEFLKIVQQRSFDLLHIINDILDISRIEVGQMEIMESQGYLSKLMDELYHFYITQDSILGLKKQVELKKQILVKDGQDCISADFPRLKQILSNLLDNALKFTENGQIEFGCTLNESSELLFYVKDSGIGIPPDKQTIIFDRFRQADEVYNTRKTGGAGLGLSICKGLVELMNGRIWVESKEGEGATFYFTIPYKPLKPRVKIAQGPKEKRFSWTGKTVLIVEDDVYNAALFFEYLGQTGIRCLKASNGAETRLLFLNNPDINLVLMDIQLPDTNGLQLTKEMKKARSEVIIIAQTAYAADNDKQICLANGCDDYIAKPISKADLLVLIDKYLKEQEETVKEV